VDVIATAKNVFAVYFGKSGVQVPHVLPHFGLVFASEYLL
jgi:hypothetical protein